MTAITEDVALADDLTGVEKRTVATVAKKIDSVSGRLLLRRLPRPGKRRITRRDNRPTAYKLQ
jgi:hypothetical protein